MRGLGGEGARIRDGGLEGRGAGWLPIRVARRGKCRSRWPPSGGAPPRAQRCRHT